MFELREVSQVFGERQVLADLSLTLSERRIGIIGANGSGKSTFARLLNGLQLPSRGEVLVDGLDTRRHAREIRRRVGFVFQNPDNQIVYPIVEEDLAFGLKNLKLDRCEIEARIECILSRYGLSHLRQHPTHLLSGGEKQLLALSSVLVMEPRCLVLDEPTTLLDLRNKRRVMAAVAALDQTVVLVTHDLELLDEYDRVLVFDEGRLVADDAPEAAIKRYAALMT